MLLQYVLPSHSFDLFWPKYCISYQSQSQNARIVFLKHNFHILQLNIERSRGITFTSLSYPYLSLQGLLFLVILLPLTLRSYLIGLHISIMQNDLQINNFSCYAVSHRYLIATLIASISYCFGNIASCFQISCLSWLDCIMNASICASLQVERASTLPLVFALLQFVTQDLIFTYG